METVNSNESHKLALPFVGRRKESARLERLHSQRKHALILGPAGVGKTELIRHVAGRLPTLICPESARLTEIFSALELQLGLDARDLKLVQRKQHLLAALVRGNQTVVFDSVDWTTPKLTSFIEGVMARVPVWLATRSEHSWDIGHVWRLLGRVERVELHPFHLAETRALIEATMKRGMIPPDTLRIVPWLQRRSAGSPLVLRELFEELASGQYDLSNPFALRRLDLDRRIHEVLPVSRQS